MKTNDITKHDEGVLASIVEPLLQWYADNRRSLPWRDDPTPYHVWLSEIMLQQTRIEAVLPYYARFLAACPTLADLAAIDDEALMKLWQGLGYYSRARNLKKAALQIMQQHGGTFPADYDALLSLPGIGDYTAGAIASIAFGLAEPAVDGNVLRVLMRLTGDSSDIAQPAVKRRVQQLLRAIYPREPQSAGAMTQALMELGQRVCIPNGAPHCESCPLGLLCRARNEGMTDTLPVKAPKKPRRVEPKTILLLLFEAANDSTVLLHKRPATGLLSGLWEFPCLDGHLRAEQVVDAAARMLPGLKVRAICEAPDAVHIFTHVEWHMRAYTLRCDAIPLVAGDNAYALATPAELADRYAIPSAFRAYLAYLTGSTEKTNE